MALWIAEPLGILAEGAGGGVVVDAGRIVELVPKGQTPRTPWTGRFDASRHVVLPGLINTHHHMFQTLTRAFPPALDKELFPWLQTMYPIWQFLTPDMLILSARLAMAELLLSGCTTVMDHHYLFNARLADAVDIEIEEARRLGLRAVISRGSINVSQEVYGFAPPSVTERTGDILDHCEALLKRHHETGEGAMVQLALAPTSPFCVTPELMRESARLARRFGARLHTHLAETRDEVAFCANHFGAGMVDYLASVDWLKDDVWLAHGIHFDVDEIARLGRAGVGICHCPSSNMLLASGFCLAVELERAGCPIGLGVDGSASNDCSNLMQEVRQALLLQRVRTDALTMRHEDALRWATEGSARCLGRSDLGAIAIGRRADLALFTLDEPRFSGHGDPLAALVLCGAHRADRVMVEGRWVVEDGTIPGLDMEALCHAHQQAARALQVHGLTVKRRRASGA